MKPSILYLALLLVVTTIKPAAAAEAARPNILMLYVDDMGWGSIGPNGQADRKARGLPYVRTPNLDRLAATGINFTRGYGCTVCSPARSSLQTGFHQGHTFADRNDPNNAKKAIRSDDISIGTALSSVGYVTGYWGKWGYGGSKDREMPTIENVQTLPTSHGYKHVLAELHHVRAHTFFQPTLWKAPAGDNTVGGLKLIPNSLSEYQGSELWPESPAFQNHASYPDTAYCDDAYTFAALNFIRTQGENYEKTGQPFFALLAVQIPHAPFKEIATLPNWDAAYQDSPNFASLADQTRQWAAMVTRIDAHFGNLLAALEDPNHDGDRSDSIVENTLIVFKSDNGGPRGKSNIELDANGGLSGSKGRIQEGGIRVPLVMNWPARINANSALKAGSNCNTVVDVSDLLPTFCELAGAPIPVGIDGVSIAPTLLGEGQQRRRDFIIHEAGNGQSIIQGKYKLVRSRNAKTSLFDLESDPAEENDIAAVHPKLVSQLHTLLIGERVAERRGFANTYHRWIGKDGGATSRAENWSDYRYANAGITYLEDTGSPRPSWIAHITNEKGIGSQVAVADADLNVLGLEIRGASDTRALQSLVLKPGVELTGRNEIRIASRAVLEIDRSTVSTLRWIDIRQGGKLVGHGKVNGIIFNSGTVAVVGDESPNLVVSGDYHQTAGARLKTTVLPDSSAAVTITGQAKLGGTLEVITAEGFELKPGASVDIVSGSQITGSFSNPNNEVASADGVTFSIGYSDSAVTLTRK